MGIALSFSQGTARHREHQSMTANKRSLNRHQLGQYQGCRVDQLAAAERGIGRVPIYGSDRLKIIDVNFGGVKSLLGESNTAT